MYILRLFLILSILVFNLSSEASERNVCHELLANVKNDSLTLFEDIAVKSGWNILSLAQYYSKSSKDERESLLKELNHFSATEGISEKKLEELLVRLYILSKPIGSKINFSIDKAREQLIVKRMEISFLKQSFLFALQDLKLIRDPTIFEIIRGNRNQIPASIMRKIKNNGISSAHEDLRQIYSQYINLQLAWNAIRKIYSGSMLALSVFMSIHMLPKFEFIIASQFTTERQLAELQDATFSPQKIRQEQFKSWELAFCEFEGRYPDYGECNKMWEFLLGTPEEQLKAHFDLH